MVSRQAMRLVRPASWKDLQGAFLSAGNAGADVEKSLLSHRQSLRAVSEKCVAAVNDDVALSRSGMTVNIVIDRSAGLDHQEDLQTLSELTRSSSCRRRRCSSLAAVQEMVHLGDSAVENTDIEAFAFHIQDQILAHHGKADQSDVRYRLYHVFQVQIDFMLFFYEYCRYD